MRRILANLTAKQLKKLDGLMKRMNYGSRSEAIRDALMLFSETERSPELERILKGLRGKKASELGRSSKSIAQSIVDVLRAHPKGLAVLEISRLSSIHRHTIRKYVDRLVRQRVVVQKKIGVAKVCFLKKGVKHE